MVYLAFSVDAGHVDQGYDPVRAKRAGFIPHIIHHDTLFLSITHDVGGGGLQG